MDLTDKSITVTGDTPLVHMNAPTHLPTKLTKSNFLVWRTQLNSTLIGLDLSPYIDGSIVVPEVTLIKFLIRHSQYGITKSKSF